MPRIVRIFLHEVVSQNLTRLDEIFVDGPRQDFDRVQFHRRTHVVAFQYFDLHNAPKKFKFLFLGINANLPFCRWVRWVWWESRHNFWWAPSTPECVSPSADTSSGVFLRRINNEMESRMLGASGFLKNADLYAITLNIYEISRYAMWS